MNSFLLWCFCLLPCSALSFTLDKSYSCGKRHHCVAGKQQQLSHRRPSANSASSRRLVADGSVLETIVAGGIAGAIGIGVAFPFDTIRTNAVILNSLANRKKQLQLQQQNVQSGYPVSSTTTASEAERSEAFSSTSLSASMSSTAEYMMESLSSSTITLPIPTFTSTSTTHSNPATSTSSSPSTSVTDESTPRNANLNMMQITAYIWEREGPQGFFSGVKSMMIGQAIVKAMAFSTNAYMIDFLQVNPLTHNLPHSATLLMAACMAGFVASFVVTPVERVSVLMQAQQTNKYASEMDCFLSVLRKEGPGDLFTRGLGATLCREVPSDGIYFWLYGLLMASPYVGLVPAALAPLLFGGFAGMASWLPIYPVDQVKTIIQNTDDEQAENKSIWSVTQQLYRDGGVAAFYDGLDAKLLRAFVHHAFTFAVFEIVMDMFRHASH